MRLDGSEVPKCRHFRYIGFIFQENGMIDEDVTHRIKVEWQKWMSATGVSCDRKVPINVKGKFYRMLVRPAMLYLCECRASKSQHIHKMSVVEMRILRQMCDRTELNKIKNDHIHQKVQVETYK